MGAAVRADMCLERLPVYRNRADFIRRAGGPELGDRIHAQADRPLPSAAARHVADAVPGCKPARDTSQIEV